MVLTKVCTKCQEEKALSEFPKMGGGKNAKYLHSWCKRCKHKRSREYRAIHRKERGYDNWQRNNPEAFKAIQKRMREKSREKRHQKYLRERAARIAYTAEWRRRNPVKRAAQCAFEGRRLKDAMPKWANRFFIREIYALARIRSEITGIDWHVDHVIPLRGEMVCGLHIESNLRVIPAIENLRKASWFSAEEYDAQYGGH